MSRRASVLLLLLLTACTSEVEKEGAAPALLEAAFNYDAAGNPGFRPKPASWSGDTLTLYDYWALLDQPVLRGEALWKDEELVLTYAAASEVANDWMPTVETRLRILVPADRDELALRFRKMPKARKPSSTETSLGVQDATGDRLLAIRRP